MKAEELYQIYLRHPRVITDSRNIEEGCMFFALKGDNFNGNAFASSALQKGAAYSVVDEADYVENDRTLLVDNVLATLQELARIHRLTLGLPLIAITGTNGKTTTKELVASVLSRKFNLLYTRGNLNNHIGVPLTLLTLTRDTQLGVIEMGANHPGEIDALCRIALPDFGLITNVGRAHLEGFGSFEGVIRTKTELYRFLEARKGTIFINKANQYLTTHAGQVRQIGYSTGRDTGCLEGEIMGTDPSLVAGILFPKGWMYIKTQLVGSYNFENVLAAATVGLHFGVEPEDIAAGIEGYKPENNRSQMVRTAGNSLLMDAYNANPSSMRAALENFSTLGSLKKGVILGDMLELGPVAAEEHQKIVDFLASMSLDQVILVGPIFGNCALPATFRHFAHSADLQAYLQKDKPSGFLFLVKGSRGMKLETVTAEL